MKSALLSLGLVFIGTGATCQPSPEPPDKPDRVWAAGYAAATAHACPSWTVDDQTVARQHGAAVRIDPDTGPTLDGALLPVFKSGGLFAEAQASRFPDFCNAPASHATRAQSWIVRFLHRR